METPKEPWGFCETPEEKCTMNYCDDNGCQNRKRALVSEPQKLETLYRKEQILKAFKEGKTIQSKDGNEWKDFVRQNQLDTPNLDYGGIDNWRIKGETIKSDNTETLANALEQIENLEAEKAELLEALEEVKKELDLIWTHNDKNIVFNRIDVIEIESLIQKMKK